MLFRSGSVCSVLSVCSVILLLDWPNLVGTDLVNRALSRREFGGQGKAGLGVGLVEQLPGRIEASRVAQVRARAAGIVQQRLFREGADVKAGQVLFRIDPAPYEAALASAQAGLARAQANLSQASALAERYRPLVAANAVSKQDYANAVLPELRKSGQRVILEPGRAIVGRAGALISRVVDIKRFPDGRQFAVLDAGMTELLRPAMYEIGRAHV